MSDQPHTPPPPPSEHPKRRWATPLVGAGGVIVGLLIGLTAGSNGEQPASGGSDTPETAEPTEAAEELTEPVDAPTSDAPEPVDEPVEEPEPTDDNLSVRGNIPKEIGDPVTVVDTWDDRHMAELVVTDIEVTSEVQTEFGTAPENGYFVILTIEGETTQELTVEDYWSVNPFEFSVFTTDGQRVNEPATMAAYSAIEDTETLPGEFGPGETFSGKLALDSPTEHGVVAYGGGVEWEF